ncbi:MAG: ketopantoate reductase family protein [Clostridiaceae bacterium]
MKKIKNISIMGLGAVGCIYASRLHDMDTDCLTVIADGQRIGKYRENKYLINGKGYDFNYKTPEEHCGPADLIIISVKYHNLSQAIKDIKNHVGENTIILSLLNGISSEEIIGKAYGMEKILYGICIGIDALRQDNVVTFERAGKVFFGEADNKTYSQKVQDVIELLDAAGIPYEIPEDMIRFLWWKYMVNVGINQSSAVLKAHYRVFHNDSNARQLMESAMQEVVEITKKNGINLNGDDIRLWYEALYRLSPDGRTSMLEDIENNRKTEVEMFGDTVCSLGEKYGVETPVNRTLSRIIKVMENKAHV